MTSLDPISWYNANAQRLAAVYCALPSDVALGWLDGLLPASPAMVLDVGAGTGRDAAWFAALGYDVVAVEPAAGMRTLAAQAHTDLRIRWLDDRLPSMTGTLRLGLSFDFILLSAVWMHLAPTERPRAFRKLASLLKPGGLLAISLRHGPSEPERPMHEVTVAELEQLARGHGFIVERICEVPDGLGRPDVHWTQVALRLPDDGTGALQLLRNIILNSKKTATYKLGLLRVLCRAADGAAGLAREQEDGQVVLPLGLVALIWLRLYLPLVRANLPQLSINLSGSEKLGFAGPGFRAVVENGLPPLDFRVGNRFAEEEARMVHSALTDAAQTITKNPAWFTTYPNGSQVFPTIFRRPPRPKGEIHLDEATLAGYGEMRVPYHLWRAFQRFACWIEPAIVSEWACLMRDFATGQNRTLPEGAIAAAMTWADPERDVALSRGIAMRLLESGTPLHCVWSGKKLTAGAFDIDHCFPWSAWPCGDLWNLLPAHPSINRNQKRDRLPGERILQTAQQPIIAWWQAAYLSGEVLPRRFADEARASLPGLGSAAAADEPEEVFSAMRLQRLRLRYDQQVPEWFG